MADTAPKQAVVVNESSWPPLYPRALGADWDNLDQRLRDFHGVAAPRHATGIFDVRHGEGRLARLLAWLLRLPQAGRDVPIQVAIHCEPHPNRDNDLVEIWDRTFGTRKLVSVQSVSDEGFLLERFGLLEFSFKLAAKDGALCFHSMAADIAVGTQRVMLPRWLSPKIEARVCCRPQPASGFDVSVKLVLPLLGLLLAYAGYIEAADARP